jgi:hypothetical protein
MLGVGDVASSVAANGLGSFLAQGMKRIRSFWRRDTHLRLELEARSLRSSALEAGLERIAHHLEAIIGHVMHLDGNASSFHPDRVVIAAQTMRAFKAPMLIVRRSGRSNALNATLTGNLVVVAGMQISIKSRLGGCEEIYVVQNRDLRTDHIWIQPRDHNHAQADPADLIVSFVQLADLTPLEKQLAVLLDMNMAAADDCRALLRTSP